MARLVAPRVAGSSMGGSLRIPGVAATCGTTGVGFSITVSLIGSSLVWFTTRKKVDKDVCFLFFCCCILIVVGVES